MKNKSIEVARACRKDILSKLVIGEVIHNDLVDYLSNIYEGERYYNIVTGIKEEMNEYIKKCEKLDINIFHENWDAVLALNYEKLNSRNPEIVFPDEQSEIDFIEKFKIDSNYCKTMCKF